jgi:type II secretory pathway pseudopilin PulG
MNKRHTGFTLVEMMIVSGVIILLAAIAIPNLLRAKVSSNDAAARASLKTIANALENYSIVNNFYPSNPNDLLTGPVPYLNKDFFTGTHNGFSFTHSILSYSYAVIATPLNASSGTQSFTITTGAVLQQ